MEYWRGIIFRPSARTAFPTGPWPRGQNPPKAVPAPGGAEKSPPGAAAPTPGPPGWARGGAQPGAQTAGGNARSSTIVWRGTHRVDLNLLPEGRCMRAFQAYSIGMATKKAVSRESILRARTAALRPLPYVHYELPADVLRRIEKLAFVKDSNDL